MQWNNEKKRQEKDLNKVGFSDKSNREVTTLWSENVDAKSGRSIHEMNAETRRIRGGNIGTSTTISRNRNAAEQRRIAGGNPYIRDELKKVCKEKIKVGDEIKMANNKLYENYLMHYRTKGSKNGYTKYPGKYTPIGEKAMAPLASITESHKIKYPEPLEKPTLNSVFNGITKGATSTSQRQREAEARRIAGGSQGTITRYEAARRANQQTAEQRRIAGGNSGMARSINAKPILSGTQAVGMRGVGAYNNANKKYPFDAEAYARRQEDIKDLNRKAAEQRRIAGGSGISASQRQKEAEARRIAGGNPYVNQREENRKAAEARRISGGTQGTITTAEAKRKNINDWYGSQVRGGNQSAAEARRIKGGTHGVTTTAQAAAENAESERKKKKLKGVLKALLKSKSHGISRFF